MVAKYDGFTALDHLLQTYRADVPQALARYRLKNLARDYDLAPQFDATVWMEDRITGAGRWGYSGEGIQELGANYFEFSPDAGVYSVGLINDDAALDLWAVGVLDGLLDAFHLGRTGTIDTSAYDAVYLMVFNPVYDDDIYDCRYYDYAIDVTGGKGGLTALDSQWDGRFFEPLD
jgi:hypothetical protein